MIPARTFPGLPGLTALLLLPFAGLRGEVTVQMEVQPARITVADLFQISVVVQGARGDVRPPQLRENGFEIVQGPSRSQYSQVTGFGARRQVVQRLTFTWSARPTRSGTIEIPPVTVRADGASHRSASGARIAVTPITRDEAFYLDLSADRTEIYPEQEVTLTLRIHARQLTSQASWKDTPPFSPPFTGQRGRFLASAWPKLDIPWFDSREGFTTTDLQDYASSFEFADGPGGGFPINGLQRQGRGFFARSEPLLFELEREVKELPGPGGETAAYHVFTLRKTFRATRQTGEFLFPAVTARGLVLDDSRRDAPEARQITARSQAVRLQVKPLPVQDQPASYSGAIGTSFSLTATARPTKLWVGSPLTLKITVSGDGPLEPVAPLSLRDQPGLADGFRLHEMPETGELSADGRSKTFTYGIRPTRADIEAVPALEFAYFDPEQGAYRTLRTREIPITVEEGQGSRVESFDLETATRQHRSVDRPIYPISENPAALVATRPVRDLGPVHLSLLIASPLLFGLLWLARKRREQHSADPSLRRERRATRSARQALSEARSLSGEGDGKSVETHDAIARALTGFVADKLRLPAAGMTAGDAARHLREREVDAETIAELEALLEACDHARYGAPPDDTTLRSLIERAEACLVRLEREVRR